MSVRFNGVKHGGPPTMAKIIFAALLTACSFGFAGGNKNTTTSPAKQNSEQSLSVAPDAVTAEDQARGTRGDVEVTRKIRENLMADGSLSTAAQNVQVITLGDTVTLKGVVSNNSEKTKVLDIANRVASAKQVVSEIQVRTE